MSSGALLSRARRLVPAAVALSVVLAISPAAAAASPTPSPPAKKWTSTPLAPAEVVEGAKSPTGKLAKSDPALLRSTSPAPVNVVVKLDYDSLAAYGGGLPGLPGTSPPSPAGPWTPGAPTPGSTARTSRRSRAPSSPSWPVRFPGPCPASGSGRCTAASRCASPATRRRRC
ncbi:hypothetical protein ACFQ0B_43300 [Nonomuraea thailandensis]